MAGWTKKNFQAHPVTEYLPGPNLDRLRAGFMGAVILALDVSGSMYGARLEQAQKGCQRFIDEAVADNYSVGVILWHHGVSAFTAPDPSPRKAREMIASATVSGGNDIVPCLRDAHAALMKAPAGDRVVAIFGDGDLGNPHTAVEAAALLKADGIRIITCGLGDESAAQLDVISSEKSESPRAATSDTIADSIASMARGLVRRPS
ncbi:vWA domain-containing protein [Mycolicibacterium llatzerense]|uniref:vWA domain-containing protein n=1 Tax=Mycolicibacterium llatzerense TaxID=280871 RepID=UPI0008DCA2CB|nr:vWA domain-containing protein [Mycolicibacterium llatzerense]